MKPTFLQVRITAEEKAILAKVAKDTHRSLSAWARITLLSEASKPLNTTLVNTAQTIITPSMEPLDPPEPTGPNAFADIGEGLCPHCARIGIPTCDDCRKAHGVN